MAEAREACQEEDEVEVEVEVHERALREDDCATVAGKKRVVLAMDGEVEELGWMLRVWLMTQVVRLRVRVHWRELESCLRATSPRLAVHFAFDVRLLWGGCTSMRM